ncbi:WYL domain-containing protein [Prosthecobacter algae]|uniref:WYL domain-containing protein n=1 Tax=Prosthecobacter algae TaxID=1144682 RepID=A0ABP9P900_9BACT
MGNETRLENWAAQERLRAVERALWWRGWIGRPDLVALFGISAAQASSDLQKYVELNPGAIVYQTSRKRYEATQGMACVLHTPRLTDGMGTFLQQGGVGMITGGNTLDGPHVSIVRAPRREVCPQVERRVFLAVAQGKKLCVKYHSVNSGRSDWRWLAPHAFGHDGLRWHVRAWSLEGGDYRDFVLGRISDSKWPEDLNPNELLPVDEDWNTEEELRYRINDRLSEAQQAALRLDYGTGAQGILKITCRRAMTQYVEAMLRVQMTGELPAHFMKDM